MRRTSRERNETLETRPNPWEMIRSNETGRPRTTLDRFPSLLIRVLICKVRFTLSVSRDLDPLFVGNFYETSVLVSSDPMDVLEGSRVNDAHRERTGR